MNGVFVRITFRIDRFSRDKREKVAIMWTSGNGMMPKSADLLIKRTNKEMCMQYTQMVEEMLWMTDVRRVDLNTGVSDKQSATNGYKLLVLWESGRTEWITLKA